MLRRAQQAPPTENAPSEDENADEFFAAQNAQSEAEQDQQEQENDETDAGWRQSLLQHAASKKSRLNKAFAINRLLRDNESEHREEVFLIALMAAASIDFGTDVIATALSFVAGPVWVPFVVGAVAGMPLFFFLWGRGIWKVRVFFGIAELFGFIPGISLIPMKSIGVLYAWDQSRKKAQEDGEKADRVEKIIRGLERGSKSAASEFSALEAEVGDIGEGEE